MLLLLNLKPQNFGTIEIFYEVAPISRNKHICQIHVHLRYSYRANDTRYCYDPYFFNRQTYAKSVNSDQTAPREAVL